MLMLWLRLGPSYLSMGTTLRHTYYIRLKTPTTGCVVLGSASVECASVQPSSFRANSMTAHCMPRQIPANISEHTAHPTQKADPITSHTKDVLYVVEHTENVR